MSHYEQRLEKDLEHIRGEVSGLATQVKQAVKNSIHALLTANQDLASATILGDGPINRKMREIDTLCHRFIAVHPPSAGHLRLMSSVIRINIILERIGDYAVTISRELQRINGAPDKRLAQGIELMANEVQLMLKQAIASFDEDNAELARGTIAMSAQIANTVGGLYEELLDEQAQWSLTERFAVFSVYYRLERIADQAKNLCEQTIFTVSGEGKASKTYQILFLDDDNSCLSQLAEAVADMDCGRDLVTIEVTTMGQDHRHASADGVALVDGSMSNQHAGHVGDGVVFAGWQGTDPDPRFSDPRSSCLRFLRRNNHT